MRIRFRASDFEYHSRKSKQDSCAETVLGSSVFFARVIQQLDFWTQKIQANVDYCYVRRRAECTSLGPGLKHPSLRSDSSLAARRRAEALHVVSFLTTHLSPARKLQLCVHFRMRRSHERRALGALLSLFPRSEPASPDS